MKIQKKCFFKNRFKISLILQIFLLTSIFLSPVANAITTTVSASTTWAAGTHAGEDVVVTGVGTTLTLNAGSFNFNSFVIQNSGTVLAQGDTGTKTGVTITVADYATINSGTLLHANGQGHPTDSGDGAGISSPGSSGGSGGSYGGVGGYGAAIYSPKNIYGSATMPTDLGSGGGTSKKTVNTSLGGPGGGAIKLVVTNTLTLNGTISVNGANGMIFTTTYVGGGGSGGSAWINVGTFVGSGTITSNGGVSLLGGGAIPSSGQGGGGGGGRIAIYYGSGSTSSMTAITNSGGQGYTTAAGVKFASNGTYFEQNTSNGDVTCDRNIRGGFDPSNPPLKSIRDVNVSGNCIFVVENGVLTATRDITIAAGSALSADALGWPGSYLGIGSGSPSSKTDNFLKAGGGGSYGGKGSVGTFTVPAGEVYGSITEPTDKGSGGGSSDNTITLPYAGGSGGGYLKLVVGRTLTVDGSLSSNGTKGYKFGTSYSGGSGSGGSIWIHAETVAGSGTISADGASSDAGSSGMGGGGGGGRIAVYSSTFTYSGVPTVNGGTGYNSLTGQAGTYHKQNIVNRVYMMFRGF